MSSDSKGSMDSTQHEGMGMDTGMGMGTHTTTRTFEVEGETITITLDRDAYEFTKSGRIRAVGMARTWSPLAWTRREARRAARSAGAS